MNANRKRQRAAAAKSACAQKIAARSAGLLLFRHFVFSSFGEAGSKPRLSAAQFSRERRNASGGRGDDSRQLAL